MDEMEREILFPTRPECPICEGTGEIVASDDLERTCPRCDGSGFEPLEEDE